MSASDHLSPDQFFHGTTHEFGAGDEITSPASRGVQPRWNATDPNYSYAASNRWEAWRIATHLHEADSKPKRVYEVQPTGPMELDPIDNRPTNYRTSSPMRVLREVPHDEVYHERDEEQARLRAVIPQRKGRWVGSQIVYK